LLRSFCEYSEYLNTNPTTVGQRKQKEERRKKFFFLSFLFCVGFLPFAQAHFALFVQHDKEVNLDRPQHQK
jgi:hypothetical protein